MPATHLPRHKFSTRFEHPPTAKPLAGDGASMLQAAASHATHGGIAEGNLIAKNRFQFPAKTTATIPKASTKISTKTSAPTTHNYSASTTPVAAPATGGDLDPAYAIGGIAAAGLGAAALAQHVSKKKEEPSVLENIGGGVVDGMDAMASTAGTVAGFAGMGLGIGGQMIAPGIAALAERVGAKGLAGSIRRPLNYLNNTSVAEFGKTVVPASLNAGVKNTAHAVAGVASVPLGALSKASGLGVLKSENIKSIPNLIGKSNLMHVASNGAFITMDALQVYRVARGFSAEVQALKELEADLTGKNPGDLSSAGLLLGNVSQPVAEARAHLLKTSGSHMFTSMASLGMMIGMSASNRFNGLAGMALFSAPQMVDTLADGIFGDSILPAYSGLRNAYNSGQQLPPEAYTQFILLDSEPLRNRGRMGAQIAQKLGEQYAAENLSPGEVVRERASGKQQARIDAIVAGTHTKSDIKEAPAEESVSHVERLQKKTQAPLQVAVRPELGVFTKKMNDEVALAAMTPASPSIN